MTKRILRGAMQLAPGPRVVRGAEMAHTALSRGTIVLCEEIEQTLLELRQGTFVTT